MSSRKRIKVFEDITNFNNTDKALSESKISNNIDNSPNQKREKNDFKGSDVEKNFTEF